MTMIRVFSSPSVPYSGLFRVGWAYGWRIVGVTASSWLQFHKLSVGWVNLFFSHSANSCMQCIIILSFYFINESKDFRPNLVTLCKKWMYNLRNFSLHISFLLTIFCTFCMCHAGVCMFKSHWLNIWNICACKTRTLRAYICHNGKHAKSGLLFYALSNRWRTMYSLVAY